MSINRLNLAMAGSYGAYTQKLSAATRAKLEELGIPYDEHMTEAEAQSLIHQAELRKSQQSHNNQSQSDFSGQNSARDNLYEQARKLALKLGISIDPQMEFKELLSKIEQALEKQIKQSENDPQRLAELRAMSSELAALEAESAGSMGFDNTNKALMMSLEMLSQYNKQQLNYLK